MAVGQGVDEGQHAAINAGQHVGTSDGADDELNWREVAGRGKHSQDDQPVAEYRDQNDDPDSQADDPALKQVIARLEGTWKKTNLRVTPRIFRFALVMLLGAAAKSQPSPGSPAPRMLRAGEEHTTLSALICSRLLAPCLPPVPPGRALRCCLVLK